MNFLPALRYLVAFITSFSATLLTMGIFFFTEHEWQWTLKQNLALAAGQGAVYTVSALLAHRVSSRWGRRKSLVALYVLMGGVCTVASLSSSHVIITGSLLVYMLFTGMNWPMLESLCAQSRSAHEMSLRVGAYNVTWAVSGMGALFIMGWLIDHWTSGVFLLPMILHFSASLLMLVLLFSDPDASTGSVTVSPEPELIYARTLALWLSRIALPAMYVVNFGISAIMPSLPVVKTFEPTIQTLYGSIWVAARAAMFAVLMATVFWHTRPRLLLGSIVALLAGFLMIVLVPVTSAGVHLAVIGGQCVIGMSMALIYTASLYFGMVLSDSSTEHGGYHEALIGLGGVLGPGAGALTQAFWPGNLPMAAAAVAAVVAISVVSAGAASLIVGTTSKRDDAPPVAPGDASA